MTSKIDRVLKDQDMIYGNDGNWRSYYQDLASFCLPRKAWINSIRMFGERLKDNFLYDIRAIRCAKEMVCGIFSHLTNPSSRWFQSATKDPKDQQSGSIQRYFKECDDIMFDVLNDSNFDDAILENYMDHAVFGTGNIYTEDDEKDEVRYTEIPVEQYCFQNDARGRVFKVYRKFQYFPHQILDRWPDSSPREVREAVTKNPNSTFDILHYIGPREKRNPYLQDRSNMPWESLWILMKPEELLSEGGYQEFPSAIGRWWKDANDPRGFSPAMDALASIKLLNAQKRTFIRHAMKASDPAAMSPYRSFLNSPNFNPSAMNYYDAKNFKPDMFKFLTPEGNSNLTVEAMELETQEIERAFYVDVFRAVSMVTQDRKKRSIPEVQRVIAEGMSMLGPVVGKLINETIDPTLERTRAILNRRLILPPEPAQIKGKQKKIIYLSPLARAQKQSQMIGISAWMSALGQLAQFRQDILDPVDFDRVSKIIADIQGVDPSFYLSDEKVQQIRKQRAQAQKAQQQAQLAETAAKAAHHAGTAKKDMAMAAAQ